MNYALFLSRILSKFKLKTTIFNISRRRQIRITSSSDVGLFTIISFRQFSSEVPGTQETRKYDSNENSKTLILPNEEKCHENDEVVNNLNLGCNLKKPSTSKNHIEPEPDVLLDSSLTDEDREKIKQYKREYEIWKYVDSSMPERVSNYDWKLMLKINSVVERINYLTYLHNLVILNIKNKAMKREKINAAAIALENNLLRKKLECVGDYSSIIYGQGHNEILKNYSLSSLIRYLDLRCLNAICDGPIIVFDCSLFRQQTPREIYLTFQHLLRCIEVNTYHRQPAALLFTSFSEKESWYTIFTNKYLKVSKGFPSVYMTENSYLDLFPIKQLLYLCPYASTPLFNFDNERVHVIGAAADKHRRNQLSLEEANAYGIEVCTLPVLNYIKTESNMRYRLMHCVLGMLLDYNLTGDWRRSILNHVHGKGKISPCKLEENVSRQEKRAKEEHRAKFLASLVENNESFQ